MTYMVDLTLRAQAVEEMVTKYRSRHPHIREAVLKEKALQNFRDAWASAIRCNEVAAPQSGSSEPIFVALRTNHREALIIPFTQNEGAERSTAERIVDECILAT